MDRRTLLQLFSSGLLVTSASEGESRCGAAAQAALPSAPYRLQFFSPEEVSLLESAMEKIIPQDDHSPGAKEARVVEFADLMIATGKDEVREDWRTGLRLLNACLKDESLDQWIETAAQNEENPQTVLDIFFRSLKQMTINGYYSSPVGIHQELQYQGNTYVTAFEGCDHEQHRSPAPPGDGGLA